jgi:hypothetical protein
MGFKSPREQGGCTRRIVLRSDEKVANRRVADPRFDGAKAVFSLAFGGSSCRDLTQNRMKTAENKSDVKTT